MTRRPADFASLRHAAAGGCADAAGRRLDAVGWRAACAGWRLPAAASVAAVLLLLAACDDANEPRKPPATAPDRVAAAASAALSGTGAVDSARFVRLEELSEVNGNPWASVAEFNVLDAAGAVIPRTGWTARADSEELVAEDSSAGHAIDGNPNSFWHTEWQGSGPPHELVVDFGAWHSVGGFRYLPRQSGPNGRIAGWRFYTSPNGSAWTLAAAGTFKDGSTEITVRLAAPKVPTEAVPAAPTAPVPTAAPTVIATSPARAARIAAFAAGPAVPGLPWRPGEALGPDAVRRLASGQHLVYTGAGTTGDTAPGPALVDGRPIVDGSATAYLTGRVLSAPRPEAPTITASPSALAAGLVLTSLAAGDLIAPRFAVVHGCRSVSTGSSFIGHYCLANGTSSGSGNATGIATSPLGARLPADFAYHANSWEEEFVVSGSRFGLVFANSASPINVEIDGAPVQAGPLRSTGAEGWTLTFDYHGVARRRTVRVVSAVGSVAPTLRGVALTADGRVEAGPPAADQLLVLGDSVVATVTPPSEAGLQMPSYWLQRDLGFDGAINWGIGGAGYVAKNAGAFNLPELLANPVDRTLLAAYAGSVTHVLVAAGFADRARPVADVQAAALATWKALRLLLPDVKISITDGWPGSTGPDAQTLALAAGLARTFAAWGDPNTRLIRVVGTSAATAYLSGTGTAGLPPADGNASVYISTDAVHPSPAGGRYLARRLADDIAAAWAPVGY